MTIIGTPPDRIRIGLVGTMAIGPAAKDFSAGGSGFDLEIRDIFSGKSAKYGGKDPLIGRFDRFKHVLVGQVEQGCRVRFNAAAFADAACLVEDESAHCVSAGP